MDAGCCPEHRSYGKREFMAQRDLWVLQSCPALGEGCHPHVRGQKMGRGEGRQRCLVGFGWDHQNGFCYRIQTAGDCTENLRVKENRVGFGRETKFYSKLHQCEPPSLCLDHSADAKSYRERKVGLGQHIPGSSSSRMASAGLQVMLGWR